jgi:penicillin-binding protein 2
VPRPGSRFLPPDPRVEEPYRFTPQLAIRIAILGVLAVAVFAVLFFRLWALQVISGDRYLEEAQGNQIRTFRIQPPRGPILDAQGRVLVTNVPGTVVKPWPAYIPEGRLDDVIRRLSVLLDVPEKTLRKAVRARENDPLTPVIVKTNVHDAKADYLFEHRTDFPGVRVGSTQLRRYERGSLAAQVLGYVGEITKEELEQKGAGYAGGDRIGKTGVEAAYDSFLRGQPGVGQGRVDALGNRKGPIEPSKLPQAGYAIRLTIDADLQAAAEDAIRYGIALARENGNWAAAGGAVVAMNPLNGELLAIASSPAYDPSIFAGRVDPKKYARLADPRLSAAANSPMLDRAVAGLYPAGSAFKPVTALAALSEGILSPDELISCVPERTISKQVFKNWDPYRNEAMQLRTAIANSCDTYFYEVGLRFYDLPPSRGNPLQEWAAKMGFGKRTGIDVGPENPGLLPTPDWRKRYFKTPVDRLWSTGHSVQLAIGQGDLLVTPLQMTRFYALLANGGKLVEPHLVKDIEQPGSNIEQPGSNGEPPVVLRTFAAKPAVDVNLDPDAIRVVQESLYDATHDANYGTSYAVFGFYPVPIAGKTGTAEKYVTLPKGYLGLERPFSRLMDQSWWCGWGPYGMQSYEGKPPLVVCALIENGGHGGEVAAPVALKVFEEHFGVEAPVSVGTVYSD